jgi:hypothetical protein
MNSILKPMISIRKIAKRASASRIIGMIMLLILNKMTKRLLIADDYVLIVEV